MKKQNAAKAATEEKDLPADMSTKELNKLEAEHEKGFQEQETKIKRSNKKAALSKERFLNIGETYKQSRKFVALHNDSELAQKHLESVLHGVHLMDR